MSSFRLWATTLLWLTQLCRVESKGCFLTSSQVTMADGSRKQLNDIREGDEVRSWDETLMRPATSVVKATPKYIRPMADLVALELPDAKIHATHDHPFWSASLASIVSVHPQRTAEEYGLEALALMEGDHLEGEDLSPLRIASIGRLLGNESALLAIEQAVDERRLRGQIPEESSVEVMTLCLHPHHWYYVEGVRVHNKGCFPGDTQVSMADGSRKAIDDIAEGDEVVSYDEELGRSTVSTVKAVPTYARSRADLIQFSLPSGPLVATEDHPIWSLAQGSLVSGAPGRTFEEYELNAQAFSDYEAFENEAQEAVNVSIFQRISDSSSLIDTVQSLRGAEEMVTVKTLCLDPHHWFYANGVRVHNKGCFVEETLVTLADGTRKPLAEVEVGDEVASWDEDSGTKAVSVVKGRPEFMRDRSDILDLELPHATISATKDHPFWSKTKKSLVSLHPEGTKAEYDLDAALLEESEELEDEHQQAVNVSRLGPWSPKSLLEGARALLSHRSQQVRVLTLCLEPHHWFYAEGVRVHNKGCFAPSTPVLMSDMKEKPISEVGSGDKVLSWDSATNRLSEATVLSREVFQAEDPLLEVMLNASVSVEQSRRLRDTQSTTRRLIVTADHPLYSERVQDLVSMSPGNTYENYGLPVQQMAAGEMLHHHTGELCQAAVTPFKGNESDRPSQVMTLRLDQHHWFFAHGVRVHNKGGGAGRGGTGGGINGGFGGFRTITHTRTRATMGTSAFAFFALSRAGSRRRYGSYEDGGDCKINDAADALCQIHMLPTGDGLCRWPNATTPGAIPPECTQAPILERQDCNEWCCYDCLACQDSSCVDRLPNCEEFLAEVYESCQEKEKESRGWWGLIIIVAIAVLCCACIGCNFLKNRRSDVSTKVFESQRAQLAGSNARGLTMLDMHGTYTENGETKPTSYKLYFQPNGVVNGSGTDDDGVAAVNGTLSWPDASQNKGDLFFVERRDGVTIEMQGGLVSLPDGSYSLTCIYHSSYQGTSGSLNVKSAPIHQGMHNVVQGQVLGAQVLQGTPLQGTPVIQGQYFNGPPGCQPESPGFDNQMAPLRHK